MAVEIHYVELADSIMGTMIVTDPNDSNKATEISIPKFTYDFIKTKVDNGTLDIQELWDRTDDVTKSL